MNRKRKNHESKQQHVCLVVGNFIFLVKLFPGLLIAGAEEMAFASRVPQYCAKLLPCLWT